MPGARASAVLFQEPFDTLDPQRWREVEVHGRTSYALEEEDGQRHITARSRNGASILLRPFRYDPDRYEWLSWRWRVEQLVQGEDLTRKSGADASARVYVYFDTGGLPWQKRNLDYVWSATHPVGTILPSPYSANSRAIVVESGAEHVGAWQHVSRNVEDDYRRCFGGNPPDVVAIGLMTDTDSTHSDAIASFDDLQVSRHAPTAAPTDASR